MGGTCNGDFDASKVRRDPTLADANAKIVTQINILEKRIAQTDAEAKRWVAKSGTDPSAKTYAMQLLKQKKMYEQQRDRLLGTHFNIDTAQFQEEQAEVTLMAARAMQQGHLRMQQQADMLPVEELERMADDMQELTHGLREASDVLARSGAMDGQPLEDLDAEWESLQQEVMQEKHAQMAQHVPAPRPVPVATSGQRRPLLAGGA